MQCRWQIPLHYILSRPCRLGKLSTGSVSDTIHVASGSRTDGERAVLSLLYPATPAMPVLGLQMGKPSPGYIAGALYPHGWKQLGSSGAVQMLPPDKWALLLARSRVKCRKNLPGRHPELHVPGIRQYKLCIHATVNGLRKAKAPGHNFLVPRICWARLMWCLNPDYLTRESHTGHLCKHAVPQCIFSNMVVYFYIYWSKYFVLLKFRVVVSFLFSQYMLLYSNKEIPLQVSSQSNCPNPTQVGPDVVCLDSRQMTAHC